MLRSRSLIENYNFIKIRTNREGIIIIPNSYDYHRIKCLLHSRQVGVKGERKPKLR